MLKKPRRLNVCALRHGAIVRGMDVDGEEVVLGEQLAPQLVKKVLRSGGSVKFRENPLSRPVYMLYFLHDYDKSLS